MIIEILKIHFLKDGFYELNNHALLFHKLLFY